MNSNFTSTKFYPKKIIQKMPSHYNNWRFEYRLFNKNNQSLTLQALMNKYN